MALINCTECGNEVSDKAFSCPKCGAPIAVDKIESKQPLVVVAPKSRSLAIALALVLGGLGFHKFYLNQPGWGFLYLIFCWTFIPAIVGLIEGIMWIFTSEEAFNSKYQIKV